MTVRFTCTLQPGQGAQIAEVELDDNLTDEQIQQEYLKWRESVLDGGWLKVENAQL